MIPPLMSRGKKVALVLGALVLSTAWLIASQFVCVSAWLRWGLDARRCPEGRPHPGASIDAWGLKRGSLGQVVIRAFANYSLGPSDQALESELIRFDPQLFVVVGDQEIRLSPKEGWSREGGAKSGQVTLPSDLPDGDYRLRAKVDTALGMVVTESPLPVFAPAKIHVLTDRPLYEPGNTLLFRALVVRARDLAPLDGRPGRWVVTDPDGEVVLEEKAPAGAYGVVAGSFPLDPGAPVGTWRVRWESGGAQDEVNVTVEPFTLPRFRLELQPSKPFYGRNEPVRFDGRVVYSSGAPVSGALVDLAWQVSGAWPAPPAWLEALPKKAVADARGRFELRTPPVPLDLLGQATLVVNAAAVDAAKDRVSGSGAATLSKDAIMVDVVTELAGGLVEGFNNRLFLRASTAGGTTLANTTLRVKRAWEAGDTGIEAVTDADGVAQLQIDPGPPVNVILPGMPIRPQPAPPPVVREEVSELLQGEDRMADLVVMDRWNSLIAPCARFADEGESISLGLQISPDGAVLGASAEEVDVLSECLIRVLRAQKLPPGPTRVYRLSYRLSSNLPTVSVVVEGVGEVPGGVEEALVEAALDARECLSPRANSGALRRLLMWRYENKSLSVGFVSDPVAESPFVGGAEPCIEARFQKARLRPQEGEDDGYPPTVGWGRVSVEGRFEASEGRQPDTVTLGYELAVAAAADGEKLGDTKIVVNPGQVPDLRLRATPILPKPGATVEVAVLRGPNFSGELPKKMVLSSDRHRVEAELDPQTRIARFVLPADAAGWFRTAIWSGSGEAQALVFVRDEGDLSVEVTPDRPQYRPRASATLSIATKLGQRGHPAAVGLFGVDESLAQITSLAGPDALGRLQAPPVMHAPAFGILEAQALVQGRIAGENAAAATISKVASLPIKDDIDSVVNSSGRSDFDPVLPLTDRFYVALGELYQQVRKWEQEAPANEKMLPPKLAQLWSKSLEACRARGESVEDAYGRALRLSMLPDDLLAMLEPRVVVANGTRLPEDIENWIAWVRKEQP